METNTEEVTLTNYRMNENCEPFLLFTIPVKNAKGKMTGYTTLGEVNAYNLAVKVLSWLGYEHLQVILPRLDSLRGKVELYTVYRQVMDLARVYCEAHLTCCSAELTSSLVGLEGRRVEVTSKDGETRRFNVGKSTGWLPCHLEVHNSCARGGAAVFHDFGNNVRVIR